jgi:hypothetical protein
MDKKLPETLDGCIDEIVSKIKAAAKDKMPEFGRFEEISYSVDNPKKSIYADKFTLRITQPAEEQRKFAENFDTTRYLRAIVDSPKGEVSRIMIAGTKNEIMSMLEDPQINEKILAAFEDLASHARHY